MLGGAPIPNDPKPISDALRAHIADNLTRIPSGTRGKTIAFSVATTGGQFGFGQRFANGSIGGWAGIEKKPAGGGWGNLAAGVEGAFTWQ